MATKTKLVDTILVVTLLMATLSHSSASLGAYLRCVHECDKECQIYPHLGCLKGCPKHKPLPPDPYGGGGGGAPFPPYGGGGGGGQGPFPPYGGGGGAPFPPYGGGGSGGGGSGGGEGPFPPYGGGGGRYPPTSLSSKAVRHDLSATAPTVNEPDPDDPDYPPTVETTQNHIDPQLCTIHCVSKLCSKYGINEVKLGKGDRCVKYCVNKCGNDK